MRWFCLLELCVLWMINSSRGHPTDSTPTVGQQTSETGAATASTDTSTGEVTATSDYTADETVTTTWVSTRSPKPSTDNPLFYHYSLQHQTQVPNVQCGRRTTRNARIVGGSDSYFGEFPWAVSVRLLTTHYCGGTIINKYWILTAAHCVKRYAARFFRVRPGGRDVELDESRPWDIHVEEVSVHPNFGQPRRYSNDLALLKLKRPIRYSDQAQPICLPRSFDDTYEGMNATAVGWGFQKEGEEVKPKKLQKVEVPILNNSICAKWYSEAYNGYVQIHDYQICAGYKEGGKDACKGDSGGPLVIKTADHFTLIGVVSAGVGCGRQHLPGIYSRVSVFVPWINRITGGLYA